MLNFQRVIDIMKVKQYYLKNTTYPKFFQPLHFADRIIRHLLDFARVADKPDSINSDRGLGDVCAYDRFPIYKWFNGI